MTLNREFRGLFRGLSRTAESGVSHHNRAVGAIANNNLHSYSAAKAKRGFTFADDTMKSEMRGTISDLKRDPLNTP